MGLIVTPGYVGSDLILDGSIVNADVSTGAGIVLSKLATSTSSQLASIISDETGSGLLVFGTSPSFTTDIRTPKVTTSGATNLVLDTNTGTSTGNITIATGVNSNINITPNGTGSVVVASTIVNTTSNITASGANANINLVLAGKGTGVVDLGAVTAVKITGGASTNLLSTNGSGVLSWVATPTFTQVYPTSGIANSTGSAWGTSYSTTGSSTVVALGTSPSFVTDIRTPLVTTASAVNLVLNTNAGTTTGSITINTGVNGNIAITPNGTGNINLGDTSASGLLTTGSLTANLVLSTNGGTTSSSVTITAGANGNISLTPNGTGSIVLAALSGILKGTSGTVSAAAAADINSTFGSQTQNFVYAAPSGANGNPTFRALVAGDIPGTLSSLIITGNLTVNGTTTTINSNTVSVDDKNLELGGVASVSPTGTVTAGSTVVTALSSTANIIPGSAVTALTGAGTVTLPANTIVASVDNATEITLNQALTGTGGPTASVTLTITGSTDATANGGGITLLGATNKTIIWDSTNSNWTSSEHWNIASTKVFKINNVTVLDTSQVLASATGVTVGGTSTTTVALGTNSSTLSTTTVGGAITGNILRINSAAAGTATFTTNNASNLVINTNGGTSTGNITINTGANGAIVVTPNGSGAVQLVTSTTQLGVSNTATTLTTNGTSTLTINTNSGTNAGSIVLNQGVNGNIAITPNGTGIVNLGDMTGAGLVTTGTITSNLTLNTNNGTTSGSIVITAGTNGNIAITPNGTGVVDLGAVTAVKITGGANGNVLTTNGSGVLSWGAGGGGSMVYPASGIANSTGTAWGTSYSTTGSSTVVALGTSPSFITDIRTPKVTTATAVNLVLDTNAGTSTGNITINTGVNGNIAITPNGTGSVLVGDQTTAGTVTTGTITANLTLNTNNGTTSGSVVLTAGANGAIVVTPNGSGAVQLVTSTTQLGVSNTATTLTTNGTGNLTINTNSGTNAGSIVLNQGVNGNIILLPNGAGQVLIGNTTAGTLNIQGTSTAGTATITTNVTTGAVSLMTGLTTATMTIGSANGGRVAIAFNQASTTTTSGALTVAGGVGISGALNATTKSFIIPHPTKPGKLLKHGSLEGPEFGVYVRGKVTGKIIELPDYWTGLVDEDTITVDLTPIGKHQKLYVEKIEDNRVYINNEGLFSGSISCFYTVWGERKDVGSLEIELDE